MTKTEISTRRWRGALALLGAWTGLLFLAMPASAQEVCGGDPDDIPAGILDLYVEELDDEWGVALGNEDFCAKIEQNFIKACQSAVKDGIKCIRNQINALAKQNKEGCKEFADGDEEKACSDAFKAETQDALDSLSAEEDALEQQCEFNQGEDFFDVCFFGFP